MVEDNGGIWLKVFVAILIAIIVIAVLISASGPVMMGGMMGFGLLFMLLPIILIIAIIYALLDRDRHPIPQPQYYVSETPLNVLERRYASGDVSREDYLRAKEDLKK